MAKTVSQDAPDFSSGGFESLPEHYEVALAELEALVTRMENGALSLEDSLEAYRRGAVLVGFCQQQLEKAEQEVRVLDGTALRSLSAGMAATNGGDDN